MSKLASSERAEFESGSMGESMVWLAVVVVGVLRVDVVAVAGVMVLASDSASDMPFRGATGVKKRTVNRRK